MFNDLLIDKVEKTLDAENKKNTSEGLPFQLLISQNNDSQKWKEKLALKGKKAVTF